MANQLFFGKFIAGQTVGNQYYTNINTSTTTVGSPIISNIVTSTGTGTTLLLPGGTIDDFGTVFSSPPTILTVDSATQITVDVNAPASSTGTFFGVNTPPETYYLSGSFTDPQFCTI